MTPNGRLEVIVFMERDLNNADPFNNRTHNLLSLHESLREEISQVPTTLSVVDARRPRTAINESLRKKGTIAHIDPTTGAHVCSCTVLQA